MTEMHNLVADRYESVLAQVIAALQVQQMPHANASDAEYAVNQTLGSLLRDALFECRVRTGRIGSIFHYVGQEFSHGETFDREHLLPLGMLKQPLLKQAATERWDFRSAVSRRSLSNFLDRNCIWVQVPKSLHGAVNHICKTRLPPHVDVSQGLASLTWQQRWSRYMEIGLKPPPDTEDFESGPRPPLLGGRCRCARCLAT